MRKSILIALLLSVCVCGYAQWSDDVIKKEGSGFIQYDGQCYPRWQATYFPLSQDSLNLVISPEGIDNETPFQIYIKLAKGEHSGISEGFYSFDAQNKQSNTLTSSPFFVRIYNEWGNAQRAYEMHEFKMYIQRFGDDYLISGRAKLDDKESRNVQFFSYGALKEDQAEVAGLLVFNPENYLNNQGNILLGEENISTTYAFQERRADKRRICIIDRLLYMDRELEHGVSFEFNSTDRIASGKFIMDDPISPVKATFFNQGEIEHPVNVELNVKYNQKKNEYVLNYQLEFSDNQILKGSYKGKIPEDKF